MKFLESKKSKYKQLFTETMSLESFLRKAKKDPSLYASPAERMLAAIGEPTVVDTAKNPTQSRIFGNRKIKTYKSFKDFYGMEEVIERIVSFFKHASQGLEEARQVLYLLGPVGSAKSSLAERLKELMEMHPIYVLADAEGNLSPIYESPLGVCDLEDAKALGIPGRYLTLKPSPWALKRISEYEGDLSRFQVVKTYPSQNRQIAISKTEPGDENNQDISTLVGKLDIRKLEFYPQSDPDAYTYSGGLCLSNQGILEFVEMFKAPIKVLHPLLTATQERNYKGTEAIGSIPFDGVILAHCFSADTQLLTKEGWKYHSEINLGDMLGTMNPSTGQIEYQPALKKFIQHYSGLMYHFNSHSADHLVTPNHKMLVHTQYTDSWKSVTAEEFNETGQIVPVSAGRGNVDYNISDELLRLQIQVVADGSLQCNKIRFHLKKPRKIAALTKLLEQLNLTYTKVETKCDTIVIAFDNPGITKDLPNYFTELSQRQALIVLREYAATDGTDNGSHAQLSSNNLAHMEMLQQLAVTAGCKANLCENIKDNYSPHYFLSIRFNVTETRADYIKSESYYSGKVFCFETPNHTLIARRNGKVLITSNSNEAEWETFRNNKNNEAFLDRVYIVEVPYCLRVDEEIKIYKKLLSNSALAGAPCAPGTLRMLAEFCVLSRLDNPKSSVITTKMEVYNGKNMKEKDTKAKSYQEYKDLASKNEGFFGISTRLAYKVMAEVFNFDSEEIAADPVHLLYVLEKTVNNSHFNSELTDFYLTVIKSFLAVEYSKKIGKDIQTAYLDSYAEYGQALFDRYIMYADHWVQDTDYRDPDTGAMYDRSVLNAELEKLEKPANIANPKDFRHDVVTYALRYQAQHDGNNPDWKAYEKLRRIIEETMFSKTEDLLPVISFGSHKSNADKSKHDSFVDRMVDMGYTRNQVRRLVEWHTRMLKA